MAITPLLGSLAEWASEPFAAAANKALPLRDNTSTQLAADAVVVCGYGEIGSAVLRAFDEPGVVELTQGELPQLVAFDSDPSLIESIALQAALSYAC